MKQYENTLKNKVEKKSDAYISEPEGIGVLRLLYKN